MTDLTPQDGQASALDQIRDLRPVLEWLRGQERRLAALRDTAIVALVEAGLSYEAVARESGVTRGRVGQIVHGHHG